MSSVLDTVADPVADDAGPKAGEQSRLSGLRVKLRVFSDPELDVEATTDVGSAVAVEPAEEELDYLEQFERDPDVPAITWVVGPRAGMRKESSSSDDSWRSLEDLGKIDGFDQSAKSVLAASRR